MMGYGEPTTTPGGRALKFYSTIRIDLRRIAQIKKGEEVVGNRVRAKVAKNKVAAPFRTAEFDIMFMDGISYEGDVMNVAITKGIIRKSGNTYSFGEEKLGVGVEAAKAKLKEDKKLFNEILKQVRKSLEEVVPQE